MFDPRQHEQAPAQELVTPTPETFARALPHPGVFDETFSVKPTVIDAWIEFINERPRSVMELASVTSPVTRQYAESLTTVLALAHTNDTSRMADSNCVGGGPSATPEEVDEAVGKVKQTISAGVHYGACIGSDSAGVPIERGINHEAAADFIGEMAQVYGGYCHNNHELFSMVRDIEIAHTRSDLIATTLGSVQDHIANIFGEDNPDRAQVLFYVGAVAGIVATQVPRVDDQDGYAMTLREGINDGHSALFAGAVSSTGQQRRGASDVVEEALATQYSITLDKAQSTVAVNNSRKIQIMPNECIDQADELLSLSLDDVSVAVIEQRHTDDDMPRVTHTVLYDLGNLAHIEGRIVAIRPKFQDTVLTSYAYEHPFNDVLAKLCYVSTK